MLHSKEERRLTCVHEAGHAVIGSLIRDSLHTIAIAPVGNAPLDYVDRRGRRIMDATGVCDRGGGNFIPVMRLEIVRDQTEGKEAESSWYWGVARRKFRPELLGMYQDSKHRKSLYQEMRGYLCHHFSGYVAESIHNGEEFYLDEFTELPDIASAHAIACLLPFRHEFSWYQYVTTETLREHWTWVIALADCLESAGVLEFPDNDHLLPQHKENWPPPPPPPKLWNPYDNLDPETGRWLPPKPAPRRRTA